MLFFGICFVLCYPNLHGLQYIFENPFKYLLLAYFSHDEIMFMHNRRTVRFVYGYRV